MYSLESEHMEEKYKIKFESIVQSQIIFKFISISFPVLVIDILIRKFQ